MRLKKLGIQEEKKTKGVIPTTTGKENLLFHGTSKESAKRIKGVGGFKEGQEKGLKSLSGFDIDPKHPISLTRDINTAKLYSGARPEGGVGELLSFKSNNLKIASMKEIKKLKLDKLSQTELIPRLKKLGYDGFDTSSVQDELVETIVFNKKN